ncbi:hypothetical protein GN958_ATG15329 [Phytophthora infestans]|uniref:Uncharacterized protein n=1 Tax=Phytophthora infestans TaxID=4787 RepID=A0A8S9U7N7_PHYIN|nr:hypothetical protein GN958_ATG15329 [Phytophthora infestans]
MSADAQACLDSFAFFSNTPLVVQQPPARRLLVVIPLRRECCSRSCDSSARVTYFTALTSTSIHPAQAGVAFVESRGVVLFEAGQQRAQLAVEVLPALADSGTLAQRAFAVRLEAPMNASTTARLSTEIIMESASLSKSTNISPGSTLASLVIMMGIISVAGLVVLAAYWFQVRCSLPRRARSFEYKLVLLPRRRSGTSENFLVSIGDSTPKKSSKRRTPRRVSSFKNWKTFIERCCSDHVVPGVEMKDKQDKEKKLSEDADDDIELERGLIQHLASIQSPSPSY